MPVGVGVLCITFWYNFFFFLYLLVILYIRVILFNVGVFIISLVRRCIGELFSLLGRDNRSSLFFLYTNLL